MAIDKKLIDQLLDYQKPEDIIGENGLLKELTKQHSNVSTSQKTIAQLRGIRGADF